MSASESSILQEETRLLARLARGDKLQQQNLNESDSESCLSPIPTIVLEDRAKTASADQLAANRLSMNESDSEVGNRLLALPEDHKPKHRSRYNAASDIDEESSSEYEATNDHSHLCLVCFREKSVSNDSVGTENISRRIVDKTRR